MAPVRIFISIVQKEFASERAALCDYPSQYFERMGTGTRDIIRHCRDHGLPEPAFTDTDGFVISLRRPEPPTPQVTPQVDPQATPQVKALQDKALSDLATILSLSAPQATPQVTKVGGQVAGQVTGQVEEQVRRVILILQQEMSRKQLQEALALKGRANFEERYLNPALAGGFIERTVPDKPNSRLQKYRLTEKGRAWLAARTREDRQ